MCKAQGLLGELGLQLGTEASTRRQGLKGMREKHE